MAQHCSFLRCGVMEKETLRLLELYGVPHISISPAETLQYIASCLHKSISMYTTVRQWCVPMCAQWNLLSWDCSGARAPDEIQFESKAGGSRSPKILCCVSFHREQLQQLRDLVSIITIRYQQQLQQSYCNPRMDFYRGSDPKLQIKVRPGSLLACYGLDKYACSNSGWKDMWKIWVKQNSNLLAKRYHTFKGILSKFRFRSGMSCQSSSVLRYSTMNYRQQLASAPSTSI